MSVEAKSVESISELRQELNSIPRARLQFAKALVTMLSSHNISISGDLLGRITLATCDEVKGPENEVMGVWTN